MMIIPSHSGPRVSRRQSYGAPAPPTSYDAPILPLSSSSSSSYSSPSSSSSSSYSSPSSSSSSSYDAGSSGGTSNSGGAFRPSTGGSSASSQAAQPIYGPVGDGELEVGVRDIMVRILCLSFSHYWQISYFLLSPSMDPLGKVI